MKKILFAFLTLMFSSVVFAQHDQYGEWEMIKDGDFYLKSTTSNSSKSYKETSSMEVYANHGDLYLTFWLNGTPKEIDKLETQFGVHSVVEMEMSFDNGEYGFFTFEDLLTGFKNGYHSYVYTRYDRFKKTSVWEATSFLKQMANKRTLKIRYKYGSIETQTFNLEGLDAILELLGK